MNITVFTSNQPRHISLIEQLSDFADNVYAVMECNTVFPGKVKDFYNNSVVMQDYFSRVIEAERKVFDRIRFLPSNVSVMPIKMRDLNKIPVSSFGEALHADKYIIFGSSYIQGPLADHLLDHRAINIHMGVSPYYRGNSCNFWASYDGNFELVGATIHMLSRGLDSGDILFHALPSLTKDPFEFGMLAVLAAHRSLVDFLKGDKKINSAPMRQDKQKEIRYTRNRDFTDKVAQDYLKNLPSPELIAERLAQRNMDIYLNPSIV